MNQRSWTPLESEFLAENELVEIMPSFKGEAFHFISGTFGPFRPAKPVKVPLWLAVYLKQRNKCDVQVPNWLSIEFLKRVRTEERHKDDKGALSAFTEVLPYHYFEVAHVLLTQCEGDFEDPAQTKSILEDIKEARKEKLVKELRNMDPDTPVKYLSFAGAHELNYMRPVFQAAFAAVHQMQTIKERASAQDQQ